MNNLNAGVQWRGRPKTEEMKPEKVKKEKLTSIQKKRNKLSKMIKQQPKKIQEKMFRQLKKDLNL